MANQWGIKSLDVSTDNTTEATTFTPTALMPDQSTIKMPGIVVYPHQLKLFQSYFPAFMAWYSAKHADGSGPDIVDMAELSAAYEAIQSIPAPPPPSRAPTIQSAPPILANVPS